MGTYTKSVLDVTLKADVPQRVIDYLNWLVTDGWPSSEVSYTVAAISDTYDKNPPFPDDHPYFKTGRYCEVGKDYYGGPDESKGEVRSSLVLVNDRWVLHLHSHCKNYDSQLDLFYEWISPYCELAEGQVVGTWEPEPFGYDEDKWIKCLKVIDGKITDHQERKPYEGHLWT